jgi:CHAT domain-containing protein
MSHGIVANIYRDMGDVAQATDHYLTAIKINERTKDIDNRAWYFASMGEMQKNNGLYNQALKNLSRAEDLYDPHRYALLVVDLLINRVDIYAQQGDKTNMERYTRIVFDRLEALGKEQSTEAYNVYLILGQFHHDNSTYDSALYYYQRAMNAAIPTFQSLDPHNNPTEEMIGTTYVVYGGFVKKAATLAAIYHKSQNSEMLADALSCLALAERLLGKKRDELDLEDAKWQFLDANYNIYDQILSTIYQGLGSMPHDSAYRLAFQYLERSKSRSLADALDQAERNNRISENDSLFRSLTALKRRLFAVQDQLSRVGPAVSPESTGLRSELVSLDRQLLSLRTEIETQYPGYFNVKFGRQRAGLSDLQHMLRNHDKKEVVIEYFWGDESVYAMAVSQEGVAYVSIGHPDTIQTTINSLLTHFGDEHSSMDAAPFKRYMKNAHRLFQLLLGPFSELLASNASLRIIPDGAIAQIPFEVLVTEPFNRGQVDYRSLSYLIKSHVIGYAYSSSMLGSEIQAFLRSPRVLGVGFTGGRRLCCDPELEDIVGAEIEMESLARRFDNGEFLVGLDATESNFKLLAPEFDIIHMAIHGKGEVDERFSSSLFFRSSPDTLDDGELHAYELYGLKLNAMLAVLSACESGLGKGYRGEGMISMASAFTFSGCQNIVMSLWKVNDQVSIAIMETFYDHLMEGEAIDVALRASKLAYLEQADELTADPAIWGPSVAYGSLAPVFRRPWYFSYRVFLALAGAAGIISLGIIGWRRWS